jgi:hypothetical protein
MINRYESENAISAKMKTQIDIRKTKKWAILFMVLMALSVSMVAQPAIKSGYNKEVVSMVEQAWNHLDKLAVSTESHIRYQAPAEFDDNPEEVIAKESLDNTNSAVPVLLVESAQERKNELKSNRRSGSDVIQVGYFQKSNNTGWYKLRSIFTKKPAVNCNVCTRVVSTPYVVYLKPRVK